MRLFIFMFSLFTIGAMAQPYGITPPREENTDLIITEGPVADQSNSFPYKLSDLPALLAAGKGEGHTVAGVIPYAPIAPLWADNSGKERYIALPGLSKIGFTETEGWDFPEHAILIKNFALPLDLRDPESSAKLIETRILWKNNGGWWGYTYEWNEEETDAELLSTSKRRQFEVTLEDGSMMDYEWVYPSRFDCRSCHTPASNFVLGPSTPQMNTDYKYPGSGITSNQIKTLDNLGVFEETTPDVETLYRMVDYRDDSHPADLRAKSYLASNCSYCHQTGARNPAQIDFSFEVPEDEMKVIGVQPGRGSAGIDDPLIVAPGDPERSVLYVRMATTESAWRMPPLATSIVDEEGLAAIRQWIQGMVDPAPSNMWQFY